MLFKGKWEPLRQRMRSLNIDENDIDEKFILGSGSGGQKINKTSSCVWIKHLPTKITVKCQQERSQEMNRYVARVRLCEKIHFLLNREKSEKQQAIEKIKRQKKRRSRKQKQKMLDNKKHRAKQKQARKRPNEF